MIEKCGCITKDLRKCQRQVSIRESFIPAFWPSLPPGVCATIFGSEPQSCLLLLLLSFSVPFSSIPPSKFSAEIHVCDTHTSKISSHTERGTLLKNDFAFSKIPYILFFYNTFTVLKNILPQGGIILSLKWPAMM